MTQLTKKFGVVIRKEREKLGLSQESFAEKAAIHRTYISSIELGKVDVSITIADKLAKALKTKLSLLIRKIGN